MSIGSEIREERPLGDLAGARPTGFSAPAIPYILAAADGLTVLLSGLVAGFGYNFFAANSLPNFGPYFAVGLLATIIHILQMKGKGYYVFPDSAKPGVEIDEILVSWCTTALLLALLAFLFKVGVDYSRGSFLTFCLVAPAGLLAIRKITKIAVVEAVLSGAIGRRDAVLVGDVDEISSLGPRDLMALFGAAKINRFLLAQDDDPSERMSADSRIMSSVAGFVRRHNCREILLALP